MPKMITDRQADGFLMFAFFAWAMSVAHPAIGILFQLPAIIALIWKCNVKTLPALLVLMLDRSTIRIMGEAAFLLKIGITLSPSNVMALALFVLVLLKIVQNKYDSASNMLAWFWLPGIIPALVISFTAKRNGLMGIWADPIMAFLAPSLYFWGMSMGATYEEGKEYLFKRLTWVLLIINLLHLCLLVQVFTFTANILAICLAMYYYRIKDRSGIKTVATFGAVLAFISLVFLRYMYLIAADSDQLEHSSFSSVGVVVVGILLAQMLGRTIPRAVTPLIPILMVVANVSLVTFVLETQESSADYVEAVRDYADMEGRFKWKMFGDRAAVWKEGWEDCKAPPLVFKDMRQCIIFTPVGPKPKILPHNQFLTLISRNGWWLGVVLSLFICIVQIRVFRMVNAFANTPALLMVLIPAGAAIFGVIGVTGQSVATSGLWSNGLACYVMPGVAYGYWRWRKEMAAKWDMPR